MAFRLPAQEPTKGTYLETTPILNSMIRATLKPGEDESETSAVWSTICVDRFPRQEGYITASEKRFGGGLADIYTMHAVEVPRFERKYFFVVEYKAPGDETEDDVWDTAADQLRRYLGGMRGQKNRRIFGATAVGKTVRFYEFNGELSDLNGDGTIYYIDRQCKTVSEKLQYIRTHHH